MHTLSISYRHCIHLGLVDDLCVSTTSLAVHLSFLHDNVRRLRVGLRVLARFICRLLSSGSAFLLLWGRRGAFLVCGLHSGETEQSCLAACLLLLFALALLGWSWGCTSNVSNRQR